MKEITEFVTDTPTTSLKTLIALLTANRPPKFDLALAVFNFALFGAGLYFKPGDIVTMLESDDFRLALDEAEPMTKDQAVEFLKTLDAPVAAYAVRAPIAPGRFMAFLKFIIPIIVPILIGLEDQTPATE